MSPNELELQISFKAEVQLIRALLTWSKNQYLPKSVLSVTGCLSLYKPFLGLAWAGICINADQLNASDFIKQVIAIHRGHDLCV